VSPSTSHEHYISTLHTAKTVVGLVISRDEGKESVANMRREYFCLLYKHYAV